MLSVPGLTVLTIVNVAPDPAATQGHEGARTAGIRRIMIRVNPPRANRAIMLRMARRG